MHLPPPLADVLRGALDLLFAPQCLSCRGAVSAGEPRRPVCRTCWSRLRTVPPPRCPRCWEPLLPHLAPTGSCLLCPRLRPALRVVRSAWVLQGPARELVHALKYGGWPVLSGPLGEAMAEVPLPLDVEEEVRWVVPVPLSSVRRRQRGYNQAELLATSLARRRGWVCRAELLQRTRSTETQTALHPSERRANVAGAFRVPERHRAALAGEHVLLVDDVWTTGATASACVDALLHAGARTASVVTLARAVPDLVRGTGT